MSPAPKEDSTEVVETVAEAPAPRKRVGPARTPRRNRPLAPRPAAKAASTEAAKADTANGEVAAESPPRAS